MYDRYGAVEDAGTNFGESDSPNSNGSHSFDPSDFFGNIFRNFEETVHRGFSRTASANFNSAEVNQFRQLI